MSHLRKMRISLAQKPTIERGRDQDQKRDLKKRIARNIKNIKKIKNTEANITSKTEEKRLSLRDKYLNQSTRIGQNINKNPNNQNILLPIKIKQIRILNPPIVHRVTQKLPHLPSRENSANSAKAITCRTSVMTSITATKSTASCSKITIASSADSSKRVTNILKMSSCAPVWMSRQ